MTLSASNSLANTTKVRTGKTGKGLGAGPHHVGQLINLSDAHRYRLPSGASVARLLSLFSNYDHKMTKGTVADALLSSYCS
jgi:hypothetical protein